MPKAERIIVTSGTVLFILLILVVYATFHHRESPGLRRPCQSQMKDIALAFVMYTYENNDTLPSSAIGGASDHSFRTNLGRVPPPQTKGYRAKTIFELLYMYKRNKDLYFCNHDPLYNTGFWRFRSFRPSYSPSARTSYVLKRAINQAWLDPKVKARRMKDYRWPAEQIMFYERGSFHWGGSVDLSDPKAPKPLGVYFNCAFMDGHVKTHKLTVHEPDYYNADGKRQVLMKRPQIDPRLYCDWLE